MHWTSCNEKYPAPGFLCIPYQRFLLLIVRYFSSQYLQR